MCLGMSAHNAGKATDAAMERIAPIFIDHQAAAHRMLADAIDQARSERPSLDDRRRRAGGQGVALEPLTEAEYYEMVAQREGRADLPTGRGGGPRFAGEQPCSGPPPTASGVVPRSGPPPTASGPSR